MRQVKRLVARLSTHPIRVMSVSPAPSDTEVVVVAATFKVLVLGNSSVGKSTLISLYSSGGNHPGKLLPTVGT